MRKLWTERVAVGILIAGLAATVSFAAEKSQESPGSEGKGSGKEESAGKPATTLPADFVNYTESIPGTDLTFEMIAVPGGTFLMGSPASETGRKDDEGPQHEVTVSPFWISKTEVMWDQYDAFRNACPGVPKGTPEWEEPDLEDVDGISGPTPPYGDPYRGFGGGNRPAIGVSWHATMTHCLWLSKVTGKFHRLPTEAEWEYACRAGSKGTFCFGDDVSALGEYAWYKKNSEHQTHPVGTKKPNAWSVQDMHGNVSEWCLDWYQPDYVLPPLPPRLIDPFGTLGLTPFPASRGERRESPRTSPARNATICSSGPSGPTEATNPGSGRGCRSAREGHRIRSPSARRGSRGYSPSQDLLGPGAISPTECNCSSPPDTSRDTTR